MSEHTVAQPYTAAQHTAPEAMQAVAAHVAHEYGHTGYSVGLALGSYRISIFEVRHADGSTFNLVADCWGNVRRPAADTRDAVETLAKAMYRDAVQA